MKEFWKVAQDLSETNDKKNYEQETLDKQETVSKFDYIRVTIILELGKACHIILPIYPEGKYVFEQCTNSVIKDKFYLKSHDGFWYMYTIKPVYIVGRNGRYVSEIKIDDQVQVSVINIGEKCLIDVEYLSKQSIVMHNYRLLDKKIEIGNSDICDIRYKSMYVKPVHTAIFYNHGKWEILVHDIKDYFLLNGKMSRHEYLSCGDIIQMEGLKIIFGIGFLTINDGNDRVFITDKKLKLINTSHEMGMFTACGDEEQKQTLFNRMPRRRKPIPDKEIRIEAPPMMLHGESIPLLLRMGGSMVMGTSSLLMGNYTMVLSSVLFPILTSKYSEKQLKEYEMRRVEKYTKYLDAKKREIDEEKTLEEKALRYNYPELSEVFSFVSEGLRLWERRNIDDDFLNIRMGSGNIPLLAEYCYPEEKLDLDEDPLEVKMYSLAKNKILLENVPIMNSFVEHYICGILGSKELSLAFIKRIVMQIMITHSYDEVKTIFLVNKEDVKELSFIKYSPHCWNDQKNFRFLATTNAEALQISEYLKKSIGEELAKPVSLTLEEKLKKRPYYMVFALAKNVFDGVEILKDIMAYDANMGVSIITTFDELPKECSKIFQLNFNGENLVMHLKELNKEETLFKMDSLDEKVADSCMKTLANTNLKVISEAYTLPKLITFLEMFGVGRIEHLNALQRWKNNNPVKSLAAPVGIRTDGSLFELDLHEKYHGPHGLIAGMTGSGKSEFIITYILSLAVNYHPDEVAFLLIDYKGGGLAKAFEDKDRGIHLPHLVGTITNLDGAAIQRSLVSIQSENMRRQRIFNETKAKTHESSIDIYDYQEFYRAGVVDEPLPHLFIIADEFAELKQQESEFMDKLISTARIGRSLGVHLILATQKPAGVVNDQILSNTKFRVCLKVQDRGDSLEMLNRPEAAELRNTGRFYLQVGYNELFSMGQSAWCGAPYYPQDTVDVQKDDEIQFIDTVGQSVFKTKPKSNVKKENFKQIVGIVQYLSDIAKKEEISVRPMWKEPLKNCIALEKIYDEMSIRDNHQIEVTVGMIDDPYKQLQYPLVLNLQKERNCLIVGSSSSGKTTMIQTFLYALITRYSPEQVNIYVLDYSSRNLNLFAGVPHCGAVLFDENEGETEKLVSFLEQTIETRKKMFSTASVGNYDSYIKCNQLPLIVLVIDNLSAFDEFKKGRDLLERLTLIMRNGGSYGIKVMATVSNLNDCMYRMQHEFGTMIALQANDTYEYSNVLNVHCRYIPSQVPGRGMCVVDGKALEFQTAIAQGIDNEQNRSEAIKSCLNQIVDGYHGDAKAFKIETVREDISFEEFCHSFESERLPLGICLETGERIAIPYQQLNSISMYFGSDECAKVILKYFVRALNYIGMQVIIVRRCDNSVFDDEYLKDSNNIKLSYYECSNSGLMELNAKLRNEFKQRTVIKKKHCVKLDIKNAVEDWSDEENIRQWRKPLRKETKAIFVLFESMIDFEFESLEIVAKFEKFFTWGRGYNIYYGGCRYSSDEEIYKLSQHVSASNDTVKEYSVENQNITESKEETRAREVRNASNIIRKCFNPEQFTLLFGGQFDKQNLISLPYEYRSLDKIFRPKEYSNYLMNYRGSIVRMKMPVEVSSYENDEDDDEKPIV